MLSLCAVNSGMVIGELRGTERTEEVGLSLESLGDFDAVLLAQWIAQNPFLKELQ